MFYWIVSLGNSQTGAAAGDLMKYFEKHLPYRYCREIELK
jgi:hypothetical protein